ncbi:MAG: bifunctional phosphoribosylaminoimidazolecarboxamide formyltransferase/IMP cyclohydrolase [Bdellovibrionaceae bacterium]|nr:bifunctional phosphoribosylaminoimidazolecarboxamide formyltransferase/IMP cyclohydrolase [Bdellovibrio sp.]
MKRALVSTSDKTGLIEFLKPLCAQGLKLVSTGGTLDFLKKNNLPAIDVAEVTQFPEVLDGRVKTLHPSVHMGLLADQRNPHHVQQLKEHQVEAFDMVVGNLYPFEQTALKENSTFEDLIENIDIGGPSFLRASAKNFHSVVVVSDPDDYAWVQKKILNGDLSTTDRKKLALKVFSLTSYYDALIVQKLSQPEDELKYLNLPLKKKSSLRYGENAHQAATWFENPLQNKSLSAVKIHQGKELSYNNLLDLDAAVGLVNQLSKPACVAVKHNNPCGVAQANNLLEAIQKTIASDPKSIFGGIIAFNREVDLSVCEALKDLFLECLIAPSFTPDSLQFLANKKNLRVLTLTVPPANEKLQMVKSISGGVLAQDSDSFTDTSWTHLAEKPNDDILQSMKFGEKVAGYLKSNSIAIVYQNQTVGLGMGQVNRVDAVNQALHRMKEFCQGKIINMNEVILVSDAFFPFPDSIELIALAGIRWIVQPGGSNRDQLVFDAATKNKINMAITQTRHFKH